MKIEDSEKLFNEKLKEILFSPAKSEKEKEERTLILSLRINWLELSMVLHDLRGLEAVVRYESLLIEFFKTVIAAQSENDENMYRALVGAASFALNKTVETFKDDMESEITDQYLKQVGVKPNELEEDLKNFFKEK